jgi:putative endonuclease
MAYTYIVRCDDDTLSTGITKDINKRIKNHAEGKGPSHAKYMRARRPVELMALWQTEEYRVAAKLEYAIKKRLTRSEKFDLCAEPERVHDFFEELAEFEFVPIRNITLKDLLCDEEKGE